MQYFPVSLEIYNKFMLFSTFSLTFVYLILHKNRQVAIINNNLS